MKMNNNQRVGSAILIIISTLMSFSVSEKNVPKNNILKLPFRQAGLTERQAATHLLSRFTYGATHGEVDAIVKQGIENWFANQLNAGLSDDNLENKLSQYDALQLSNAEIFKIYPTPGRLNRMIQKENDMILLKDDKGIESEDYKITRRKFMKENGYKDRRELIQQFYAQKILRATYSNNQLQEVMTAFWFNHFNVSILKNNCSESVPNYERDVIRPGALGKFGDLLLATAQAPAMLYYLDNYSSTVAPTIRPMGMSAVNPLALNRLKGLNENYAREMMELHTLGVDGGYTQQDVTNVARIFTGWTVYPLNEEADRVQAQLSKPGFVHKGDFLFVPNRHDQGEKIVMGKRFAPNGGYQEGLQVVKMLAHHSSTATFISRKIAIRFVSDDPPQSLIDQMSKTFIETEGDIKQVLITMVSSPDFWNVSVLKEKTKSPFELAISTVRSLNAQIVQTNQLNQWITKMGEPIYACQPPTGYPDKAQYWISSGALINRINFAIAITSGNIAGVKVNLSALNNHREPESAEAALITYAKLIMPEYNNNATYQRLLPMISNSESKTSMLAQVVGVIISSPEYQRR